MGNWMKWQGELVPPEGCTDALFWYPDCDSFFRVYWDEGGWRYAEDVAHIVRNRVPTQYMLLKKPTCEHEELREGICMRCYGRVVESSAERRSGNP